MSLCSEAKTKLRVCGGNRPWGLRLRGALLGQTEWVGPVSGVRKAELLAQAKALIFPVLWPEPFGLVVIEALVSGTPVLASRRGSLPELVTPDVGALFASPETPEARAEWVALIREFMGDGSPRWSAEACRARVLEHFHYLKMAEGYENAYKEVASGAMLQARRPRSGDWRAQL